MEALENSSVVVAVAVAEGYDTRKYFFTKRCHLRSSHEDSNFGSFVLKNVTFQDNLLADDTWSTSKRFYLETEPACKQHSIFTCFTHDTIFKRVSFAVSLCKAFVLPQARAQLEIDFHCRIVNIYFQCMSI